MQRDSFDDILRSKLYDNTVTPPSWDNMEKRLILAQREQGLPIRKPMRSLSRNILRYAAAVITTAVVGLGIYQLTDTSSDVITAISADKKTIALPHIAKVAETTQNHAVEITIPTHDARNTLGKLMASARSVSVVNDNHVLAEAEEPNDKQANSVTEEHGKNNVINNNNNRTDNKKSYRNGFDWGNDAHSNSNSWIASAYSGALSSKVHNGRMSGNDVRQFDAALVEANFTKNTADFSNLPLKHRAPISFGLSIRKNLTNKLGVETGLTYTYMESFGETSADLFFYKHKQRLHYIGLPISINYSLINSKNFDLYLTGGMMFEKAISAKGISDIYQKQTLASTVRYDLEAKGLLCSANAGIGIGYYFVDNFGIYAETGVNYYIPNTSQPQSYRTANPWNLNLRAGFRFRF